MKALILAGGYATRLHPLSYVMPKALFPVCGRPILEHTIERLSSFGFDEVILGVNHLEDQIRKHFGDVWRGVRVKYSFEPAPLGTGGAIAFLQQHLSDEETFLVMNGDIISDIDLKAMANLHKSTGALATIALHKVVDPTPFGVVKLGDGSKILEFVEKPRLAEASSRLINAGICLMRSELIDRIPGGRKVMLEQEVFPAVARGGQLFGYTHSGLWFDIGSIPDFVNANFALLKERKGSVFQDGSVRASNDVSFIRPIMVCAGADVGSEVHMGPNVIVGARTRIRKGASLARTIVFDDVDIGDRSVIEGSIIGGNVTVGKGVIIHQGVVIAGHVRIHDNICIACNVHVLPDQEISRDVLTPGITV